MDSSLQDLQQLFEYELKRKLTQRAKLSSGEMKILLNVFKFFDLDYTGIITKSQWIQGILRTGLTGFNETDLDTLFSLYDKNNSGQIDYKNFCSFLYGREPLNPLTNNSQSLLINQGNNNANNNLNQIQNLNNDNNINNNFSPQQNNQNQFINNNDINNNMNNSQTRKTPIYNNNLNNNIINNNTNNYQTRQKTPIYNNNQNNNMINNNQNNTLNNNRRTPFNFNNNTNQNDNFRNNQRTPFINSNNNEYQDNSNFRQSQRRINSYNNTFNNIFQQDIPSTNTNSISNNNTNNSYNNLSESAINSIITSIKNSINTNNGVTLYSFIKKLKYRQINNTISLDELNNIFQEMRLNISLNDLQILFNNVLTKNEKNNIYLDELIQLIKGNLDERRKLYIIGIFSDIDTEKTGEVSLQLLKNIFNSKYHPDFLNGTKTEEEVYDQFCNALDLYCEITEIPKNGNLSFKNFIDFYSGISSCIPDEVYFEDMLKGVWNNTNSNNANENNFINNNMSNNNMNNEYNNIGLNSILMGISPNERNQNNYNNNNNRFSKSNRFNNNQFNINYEMNNNQLNNNRLNNNRNRNNQFNINDQFNNNNNQFNNNNNPYNNNQFNNYDRRMKNSFSSPYIADNNMKNKGNNQINQFNNINSNTNNQISQLSNTNSKNQITNIFTPLNDIKKSPEGIKVYQKKRRYNPITDEYYEVDTPSNNNIDNTNNMSNNNDNNSISNNNNYSTSQSSLNNTNNNININNTNNNINRNNINNNNNCDPLEQLRNILISRGPKSIFTFQRMLLIYDRNRSGQISFDDFNTIFQTYNLNFTDSEIQNIFQIFDKSQTGNINYDILLTNLIGQMSERRLITVQNVFDTFNKNENGEVLMSEIKQKYNSSRHPDVVNGKKNREEIYGEFLDKLEIFREYNDNLKSSFSTTMTFNEFAMFYNEISMNIKDDNLFDYLLNNCWDLDRISGNNQKNNNMNNNINNNYMNNNMNYDKNIRARTGKQIMNMNNRGY